MLIIFVVCLPGKLGFYFGKIAPTIRAFNYITSDGIMDPFSI
ncbi:MAG: hypothetical protein Q8918_17575 [Bacteroidota bacterium]|nr:hypothetical protein [Bacteroidota bacterium]MDP4251913.1 hypothetical protein [Bacteroidota bacterium]